MRYLFVMLVIVLITPLIMGGCSDDTDKKTEDHVWKEQTDTIKKADEVNQLIQDTAKKHHPEIDTGIHTLMSLNQASRLSEDPQIRFAVLVHDLGKGTTASDKLPSHRGHEERGVKLIESLCERYRAPNQFRDLAIQVSRHHLTCHRIKEMRAETILKKLESLDAFRRPERFNQFLICCEADARGRTGFEDRKYPQADYFKNALNAANGINTESLNKLGLKGKAMAEAIRKERLSAIGELLARTE